MFQYTHRRNHSFTLSLHFTLQIHYGKPGQSAKTTPLARNERCSEKQGLPAVRLVLRSKKMVPADQTLKHAPVHTCGLSTATGRIKIYCRRRTYLTWNHIDVCHRSQSGYHSLGDYIDLIVHNARPQIERQPARVDVHARGHALLNHIKTKRMLRQNTYSQHKKHKPY